MGQFNNELALLVLLARLIGLLVLPAQHGLAAITVYVSYSVQPGQENALLRLPAADVYHRVEDRRASCRERV